ncbi:zinc-dependent alcohol dehydrogenase [Nocardia sp. CA-135953]|uniref:zinc-dependent alcohol dehydrogenase n=1 Tax=Nocardia sp. CA-135953 TaxID=3239978 RepID=UPI003D98D677
MRQAILGAAHEVELDNVQVPEIGPKDALVKVEACGICGTDMQAYKDGDATGVYQAPTKFGHEIVGRIEKVGSETTGLTVGQRVVVNPCLINPGLHMDAVRAGGFADFVKINNAVHEHNLFPISDALPQAAAVTIEPAVTGFHLARRGNPQPGEKVVIFGAGTMGLAALQAFIALGIDDVIMADVTESRLALATKMGARAVVNPAESDVEAFLREHHGDFRGATPGVGTDIYIDTAGVSSAVDTALNAAKFNARIIFFGIHKKPLTIDAVTIVSKQLSLLSSSGYDEDEWRPTIDLIEAGKLDISAIVTHTFGLNAVEDALEMSTRGSEALKVVVAAN